MIEHDPTWLRRAYGDVVMARQEIEGYLWDQSLGRDLLPLSTCVGFRILPPSSVQIWGEETHVQQS